MEPRVRSTAINHHHPARISASSSALFPYIFKILPAVQKVLKEWRHKAGVYLEPDLQQQALASLKYKAFHCQGGAVYATLSHNPYLLRFIIAYQTICDYLDNLCDRAGYTDGEAFNQLHQSLLDALDCDRTISEYYGQYPLKGDHGYLNALVEECRHCLYRMPSYVQVKPEIMKLAKWYIRLQVEKHVDLNIREARLKTWVKEEFVHYPDFLWQELAAAAGSTLAIFSLVAIAGRKDVPAFLVNQLASTYFPWICSLHILLDYLIDQQEDREGGDLNFTFYYQGTEEMETRLEYLVEQSLQKAAHLPQSSFHGTVVIGLLAMYLSDIKVKQQGFQPLRNNLLRLAGGSARVTYWLCRMVRVFL
ncbi:tetraprenyl-beta-curcumene synthase family protein [Syntrophomonas erecta]